MVDRSDRSVGARVCGRGPDRIDWMDWRFDISERMDIGGEWSIYINK